MIKFMCNFCKKVRRVVIMKKVGKYILVFLVILLGFICLLIISSSFPSSLIKKNVKKSSELLRLEGNRK